MTQKTYYLFALTMPLWLPLASLPLARFQSLLGWVVVLFYSLVYGGIPYLVLLIGVLAWARNQTGASLQRAAIVSPLLFALLLPSCLLIFFIVFNWESRSVKDALPMFLYFGAFALVFGYAYVGIAVLVCTLLKRCGIIREDQIAEAPFIALNL